jgi:hypothetical protein
VTWEERSKGKIISVGDSFFRGTRPPPWNQALESMRFTYSVMEGFHALMIHLRGAGSKDTRITEDARERPSDPPTFTLRSSSVLGPVPVHYVYVQSGSSLLLAYAYKVHLSGAQYDAQVDVQSGKLLKLMNWVSDALENDSTEAALAVTLS